MEQPSYYSVTPATVRYDHRLKPNEKLLYGEITALANVKGYCYASNSYFAKLYGVKSGTVSGWVAHLKELSYIDTQTIYKENSKEIQERRIYINDTPTRNIAGVCDKKRIPPTIKNEDPMRYKSKENNTSINNTSKNINNNTKQQADASNAFTAFQMSGATLNGFTMPQLVEYVDKLGDELVRHAIEYMSNSAPKASFNYLKRILDSYENTGITTVEQAIKMEDGFRKRREQRRQNNSYTKSKPTIERDLSNKRYGTDEELEAEFFGEA